jgi:hypothetical protein
MHKNLKNTTTITMSYVLTVSTYKKGELKMPNIDIENYVEEDRWDYSNECNEWKGGGGSETITNPNRIEC